MRVSKIKESAKLAKADEYTHVYSIVKTVYSTTYCNVLDIDTIIQQGWIAAPKKSFGWYGPVGITANKLPAMAINKSDMIKKYFKTLL